MGGNNLVDVCGCLKIQDLIRQANKGLKLSLVQAQTEASGIKVEFSATRTRFGGERLWFNCPVCKRRAGVLYRGISGLVGCRLCSGMKYRYQK